MLPIRLTGRKRLRLGDLASITAVARWVRYRVLPSMERVGIAGFPSHWLGAVMSSGLFSSPRNDIVDILIEGSASRRDSPEFDPIEELERSGLGAFRDSLKVSWFKGLRVRIPYSRLRSGEGPAPNLRQLASMLSLRSVIRDGTIQRICVQDGIDGAMFLWAAFPRRKIVSSGRYDNWGSAIDDYNRRKLGRHRVVASLDLIAFSETPDWIFDRSLIDSALGDAYRPDLFKPALLPLVKGTEAEGLLMERTEPAAPEQAPVILNPLFAW